jgi:hypothetical protein
VTGSAPLKLAVIRKKHTGTVFEMENLLILWMKDKIQNDVSLSLMTIQAKARSPSEYEK